MDSKEKGEMIHKAGAAKGRMNDESETKVLAKAAQAAPLQSVTEYQVICASGDAILSGQKPGEVSYDFALVRNLGIKIDGQDVAQAVPSAPTQPELTVWYGSMPESNGKSNFTAVLCRKGVTGFDMFEDGYTFSRSEYPDRVRYEADCMRHLIGELAEKPWITDYDADKHSGYVKPSPVPTEAPALAEKVAAVRRDALEEAAKVAEDTDVAMWGCYGNMHDDGLTTRSNIAAAIRELTAKEAAPAEVPSQQGGEE